MTSDRRGFMACDFVCVFVYVEEVGNVVNMEAYGTHYLTSLSDVKSAIHRMKPHKKEGCVGLSSDHFINAGDDLC